MAGFAGAEAEADAEDEADVEDEVELAEALIDAEIEELESDAEDVKETLPDDVDTEAEAEDVMEPDADTLDEIAEDAVADEERADDPSVDETAVVLVTRALEIEALRVPSSKSDGTATPGASWISCLFHPRDPRPSLPSTILPLATNPASTQSLPARISVGG